MLATATFQISAISSPAIISRGLSDRPVRARRTTKKAPPAASVCLIVSPDPLKQLMFGQAAKRCGWRTVVCTDKVSAMEQVASGSVGMALVDIASVDSASGDRTALVEKLGQYKNLLTVVCGRTSDSQQEIWAREHAAWMYLAGVAPESDLDPVLTAAREAADRLNKKRLLTPVGGDWND